MLSCLTPSSWSAPRFGQDFHTNPLALCSCSSALDRSENPELWSPDLDWASLPAHILDQIIGNLTSTTSNNPPAQELAALYAVVSTCSTWRAVGMPVLLAKRWGPKIIHPSELFGLAPAAANAPQIRCMVTRHIDSDGLLDEPTYTLWQADSSRDLQPRFLFSASMKGLCAFSITMNRDPHSRPSSGSPTADAECAVLQTNLKRTKYELWGCRKPWVARHLEELSSSCRTSNGALHRFGLHGLAKLAKLGRDSASAPRPLLSVRYFMRMHGLLLPRRLVVEVARPPAMSSNPLFDNSADAAGASPQMLQTQSSLSSSEAGASTTSSFCSSSSQTLKLQNVLPHWSPQLKCWCLNFNNRVKLPSIKNFQLGINAQKGSEAVGSTEAKPEVLLQFGKIDEDEFVLDFSPTVMSPLQAFALALSSFERKYSLY